MAQHDAVIVGARCAGAALAIELARRDWDVLLVDRDEFPSTTVSTHGLWPNGVARIDKLGILDAILAEHELAFYDSRIRGLGNEIVGGYTAVEGHDKSAAPRRIVLDQAAVKTAREAGAQVRFEERVIGLLGSGSEEDPVRGVVLSDGEEIEANWIFGADGRGSSVAKAVGAEKERPMRGEIAMSYGYWKGIPGDGYGHMQIEYDRVLNRVPVEDGLTMLIANGPPELTHGDQAERRRKYLEMVGRFPETVPAEMLERAELVTEVAIAPEPLMQGFYRRPSGPGWALVGDAGHFKHPGTAQGISDALESAVYVAEALSGPDGDLDGYEAWREQRSAEHYEWSFAWGHFPRPGTGDVLFRGWASEPEAGQDLRDTFSRVVDPSRLTSKERLARWFADGQ